MNSRKDKNTVKFVKYINEGEDGEVKNNVWEHWYHHQNGHIGLAEKRDKVN